MNKQKLVYVIVDHPAEKEFLSRIGETIGETVIVLSVASNTHFIAAIPAILDVVVVQHPDIIITSNTCDGTLIAGMLAAQLDILPITNPSKVTVDDQGIRVECVSHGGTIVTEYSMNSPLILSVGTQTECVGGHTGKVSEKVIDFLENENVVLLEKRKKERRSVDLTCAERVFCVGRGVKDRLTMDLVLKLAQLLDAEVGCTRPIYLEKDWSDTNLYIGISNISVKPKLYLAVGISGQAQHMMGCHHSDSIFAINNDRNAPIFEQCDYGIVGDAYSMLLDILNAL